MEIIIAGASGLVGKELVLFLQSKGHRVLKLSRSAGPGTIAWDPSIGSLDPDALENCDAIINLAGENVANARWTEEKKRDILNSRVLSTKLLSQSIEKLKNPPKIFINASAIGFYGNCFDQIVDESTPAGDGFLADVCKQWEAATEPARKKGVRTVLLRIGVVLSRKGGALAKMVTPFKFCLGGKIGSGKQYMSWISLNELIHIIDFILRDPLINGPVNAVAPCSISNADFTKTLGKVLKRPTIIPLPAFVARLAFGELADSLLLSSCRVQPTKLQKSGYSYCDPSLESMLKRELQPSS